MKHVVYHLMADVTKAPDTLDSLYFTLSSATKVFCHLVLYNLNMLSLLGHCWCSRLSFTCLTCCLQIKIRDSHKVILNLHYSVYQNCSAWALLFIRLYEKSSMPKKNADDTKSGIHFASSNWLALQKVHTVWFVRRSED